MKNNSFKLKTIALGMSILVAVSGITVPAKADVLSDLKAAVDTAENELKTAQKEYQIALDNVTKAESAAKLAEKQKAKGSYGFFETNGYTDAMNVLKDQSAWVTTYTKVGQDKDATSLDNLKATILHLKKCNELRKQEKTDPTSGSVLNDLKVSMKLMAISEVQCNWSTDHIAHVGNEKPDGYSYKVAENLAWSSGGTGYSPFDGWYTKEKALWNAAVSDTATYPKLSTCKSAYQVSVTYPALYPKVGHYLNIVTSSSSATGYAISNFKRFYQMTYEQSFSNETDVMTVSEFETKLNAYCNQIETPIQEYENAKKIAAQKKAVQDEKQVALSGAQKAYADAQETQNKNDSSDSGNTDSGNSSSNKNPNGDGNTSVNGNTGTNTGTSTQGQSATGNNGQQSSGNSGQQFIDNTQPIKVTTLTVSKKASKTISMKYKTLKKKKQSFAINAKTNDGSKIAYKISKFPKSAKKYISVSKSGKVTLKKGAKKGTYKVTVSATSKQNGKVVKKVVTIKVK